MTRLCLIPLAGIAVLAACAPPEPERVEVFRPVPAALLTCQPKPKVPDPDSATQADVARLLYRLEAAGEDCRSKLRSVKIWSDAQEQVSSGKK